MSITQQNKVVNLYIDGFNLYHAIDGLDKNWIKWLDVMKLAKSLLRDGETIGTVYFFTAVLRWNADKKQRHEIYIAALRATGVEVREANFKKGSKFCESFERYCEFHEEKQTDVAFAIQLVSDAYEGRFGRAILITADSDHIPAVRMLTHRFPHLQLSLRAPPGRMSTARELGALFVDRKELTAGHLGTCLLPRDVHDAAGKKIVSRPTRYDPE